MPRNSTGAYTLPPAYNPVVTNTIISTLWANSTLADVASGMTDSLDRQGRGSMLAPLKLTDGTIPAPSLTFSNESTAGFARLGAGEFSAIVGGVETYTITQTSVDFLILANFLRAKSSFVPTATNDLVNKLYADNLAFSAALPSQTGNSGKFVRTNGTVATWEDYLGSLLPLTGGVTALSSRTSYSVDSTGGAVTLNLPALVANDWINIVDVGGAVATNSITVVRNGTDKIMNLSENLIIDIPYGSLQLRGTVARGWVIV